MITISNYKITEQLYESANSWIYRAHRHCDDQPVVLKILKQDYPPPEKIAWFKREYEITQQLNNLTGVIDVYALESDQNRFFIVLEDFGATSLDRLNFAGQCSLTDILKFAISITSILGQLHQRYLIHKDINLSNILLNTTTKQLKLIDFGISTVLSRETSTFRNPNLLEGTLAYISPEQTGRMNRSIDYRTDFYSLGVTFYELLTGQLPFPMPDALEVVHSHIAKQPVPVHLLKPDIPHQISEIVLKLMAKNAEDRYQSAYALQVDLEKCLQQWDTTKQIQLFSLENVDVSDRFEIPQKLYGRETEIATLIAGAERVSQGASEMMLVAGYSGIGKSALVQEVYKPLTRQRGYFIAGKFDQFQRDIPYASLIQAFRFLMRQLLTESETAIETWRTKLTKALGSNGQVMIEVIPELERVIGSQPTIPTLEPKETQNRFNFVFQNFIKVFTQPEHPLVVFLDDLQWADGASLKLIELLITAGETEYLFLIGAYRDNEVSEAHPLMQTLEKIKEANITVNQLTLLPLPLQQVRQLMAETFHCEPKLVNPVAQLVQVKTGGNPFFVNEFLKFLYAESLLIFDHKQSCWQWNLEQIQTQQITDNVVELMANKVQKIPQETLTLLKLAACIGNQFDLEKLVIVSEKSPKNTAIALNAAITEGFILPLSDTYKLMELDVEGLFEQLASSYKFAHDRIQQAVYSLIPDTDKKAVHLRVGQLLLHNTPSETLEQNIFDIVNQLNQGQTLIENPNEQEKLARLNLQAGKKAKVSAAYQPTFKYLQTGIGLLKKDNWQQQYELTLELYIETTEAAFLNNDFDTMEQLATTVMQQATKLLDKVKVYEVRILAYSAQNKFLEAIKTALEILKLLGIVLPEQPTEADMIQGMQEAQSVWADKPIKTLIDLPPMTDPSKLAAIRIMASIFIAAYTVRKLFVLMVCQQVILSIKYGNAVTSAFSYANYGVIFCGDGNIDIGYQFGQLALQMAEKFNDKKIKSKTYMLVHFFITHSKESLRVTLSPLLEAYQTAIEVGDFEGMAYSLASYTFNAYLANRNLVKLEQEAAAYSHVISRVKQTPPLYWHEPFRQAVLNWLGRGEKQSYRLIGEAYNEEKMSLLLTKMCDICALHNMYLNKLILSYRFEKFQEAVENATQIKEKYIICGIGSPPEPVINFYDSLAQLAVFFNVSETEQKRILEIVATNQEALKKWADNAPMNYQHKFDIVEAERARVLGQFGEAREYYDQAIAGAHENEYINEEALAYELAGRFYLARQQNHFADYYLKNAHYAYQQWGAKAKEQELEAKYPQLQVSSKATVLDVKRNTKTTSSNSGDVLDLATVMKASQAISNEIVLDKLLKKLMKTVIENAGAQKGFLILKKAGDWVIEAEGLVDSDEITTLQSLPIDSKAPQLSAAIVNYVARTQDNVVLNDAVNEGEFTTDPYIIANQPKSLLCTPLLNQGQLNGILYLENDLSTGAFTSGRLEILQLLSSQAAISIENSKLYNNLELKVVERTHKLQEEIGVRKRAEEAAQVANQAKSTFLANMSHELRSPLNAILGFTQIMTRSQRLEREDQENVGIISRSGEHLLMLINQVLDLSKIEAGRTTLNESNFDLYRLLDDLEDMFRLKADDKKLQLIFEREPSVPQYLCTDELKLRQVLINLLNNALKFTVEGGVSVRISKVASTDKLHFEIEDTGSGVAPEELDQLFEAFGQTASGKQSQEGTGLGLPISRKFVQLMGGDILVSSQVGRGTTFQFDIHYQLAEASEMPKQTLAKPVIALEPNQPSYRILIVDDKWSSRQLLIKLLNPLGFELREAENGQQAVDIWKEWQPHLIWMDMRMPVMDGYEATRRIKAHPKGEGTRIIALTASVLEEERAVVLKAGCNDFLRKPFKSSDIFDIMHKQIDVRYVYEDNTEPEKEKKIEIENLGAEIAKLPNDLFAQLQEAVNEAELQAMLTTIEKINENNKPLAKTLNMLANDFRFDILQEIF